MSHLIGRETINIPEIFSGVHGFTGKAVIGLLHSCGLGVEVKNLQRSEQANFFAASPLA